MFHWQSCFEVGEIDTPRRAGAGCKVEGNYYVARRLLLSNLHSFPRGSLDRYLGLGGRRANASLAPDGEPSFQRQDVAP